MSDKAFVGLRTVEQAAAELCVSVHTIRAWIARRKIGCVRLGRAVRIPAREITRLIEQGMVPALDEQRRQVN
jgi:excisionase family DNA binding protein